MLPSPRRLLIPAVASLFSLTMLAGPSAAGELLGKVKSVDVAGRKVVVTEKGTAKEVEVAIGPGTTWVNAKGKSPKKFDLTKLKPGSSVEVSLDDGAASRVAIKAKKAKKKVKAASATA